MAIVYLNSKTPEGRETIDELDSADFETRKAFRAYIAEQVREHAMTGTLVYQSKRPCANWK